MVAAIHPAGEDVILYVSTAIEPWPADGAGPRQPAKRAANSGIRSGSRSSRVFMTFPRSISPPMARLAGCHSHRSRAESQELPSCTIGRS